MICNQVVLYLYECKRNISSVLLSDHVRKLRQGHRTSRKLGQCETPDFRLWPSGLAVSPWSQHDAPSCSRGGQWRRPRTCRSEDARRGRAGASVRAHLLHRGFSALLHIPPSPPWLLCALAVCPPPNEELTHNSGNLPGTWQLRQRKSWITFSIFQGRHEQTE